MSGLENLERGLMARITTSGIGSGIDGAGIARALYEQLTQSNVVRSKQISGLSKENSSLGKLKDKLLNVSKSLDSLRGSASGSGEKAAKSSSNSVDSFVQGEPFKLPGFGESSVSTSANSTALESRMKEFVSRFNDLADFVGSEDLVRVTQNNGATSNIHGALSQTAVDDDALAGLRSAMVSQHSSSNTSSLWSLGISTGRDGKLVFDESVFKAEFEKNPANVAETVRGTADRVSGVQGLVQNFTAYGRSIDLAIDANKGEIARINESIDKVERSARKAEDGVVSQFSQLEGLMARLQADSAYLGSLLNS